MSVDILEIASMLFIGAIFVGIGIVVYKALSGAKGFEADHAEMEARFEREALAELERSQAAPAATSAATIPVNPPVPASAPPPAPMVPAPASDAAPGPTATSAHGPAGEDALLAEAVRRMRLMGIVTNAEGMVPLPLPPNGQILRLRTGGLAVVLPRMESEAFLAHLCRRFDMVVLAGAHGEPIVLQRLQVRMAEMLPALKE